MKSSLKRKGPTQPMTPNKKRVRFVRIEMRDEIPETPGSWNGWGGIDHGDYGPSPKKEDFQAIVSIVTNQTDTPSSPPPTQHPTETTDQSIETIRKPVEDLNEEESNICKTIKRIEGTIVAITILKQAFQFMLNPELQWIWRNWRSVNDKNRTMVEYSVVNIKDFGEM
ncbi:hypothetical protein BTUL_0071g00400 [Botrytis tulipae]|uniref:Uncharacterized protein n=1 Tax=Botrytis tulipae TaxID=87230 RepID=A0A4Z1ENZ8_9HELO|nr:hypothetical protein BTUL_0071g00400 [Botrytis tulipae]